MIAAVRLDNDVPVKLLQRGDLRRRPANHDALGGAGSEVRVRLAVVERSVDTGGHARVGRRCPHREAGHIELTGADVLDVEGALERFAFPYQLDRPVTSVYR